MTIIRLRCSSIRTTSRFWVVLRTAPMWPDIFLPLNTRPGVWFWPMGAGHAMGLGIAVGGVLAVEVVALDGAGEALADGGSGYVHALTGRKNAHGKFGAGLVFLKHGGIVHAMLIQALAGRLAGILTGERFSRGLAGRAHPPPAGRRSRPFQEGDGE